MLLYGNSTKKIYKNEVAISKISIFKELYPEEYNEEMLNSGLIIKQ